MTEKPIREWTMDEALADVQALAALGSDTQVRSALRVVAKSAIEVAEPLALAAAEIRAFIAPTQKPIVAMALGALSIFLGGAFVWASLIVEKYRAIIAIAGLLFGSSVTAFSIMTGEVSAGAVDE